MSDYTMTPLCGFGMGEGGLIDLPPMSVMRHLQDAVPTEGQTLQVDDNGDDVVVTLRPLVPLSELYFNFPTSGSNLQIVRIASMMDIAMIEFSNATVLNAPGELLANQTVTIQRINSAANTWITI